MHFWNFLLSPEFILCFHTHDVAFIPPALEPNPIRFRIAMDEITAVFANAYRSKRLVYRDIENTDADKELMHSFGPANHVSWGLLSGRLFRDVSKKANLDGLSKLLESGLLLKVLICLPTIPKEEIGEQSKLGLGARAAKERETATPIGSLTLSAPGEWSFQALTTTVGLCIGEEYQNQVRHIKCTRSKNVNANQPRQGYGAEAISWAVDWAFKFANVHKVVIETSSYNERALHLYPKLGFSFEGKQREVFYINRKYYDLIGFGMLESEWKKLRGLE